MNKTSKVIKLSSETKTQLYSKMENAWPASPPFLSHAHGRRYSLIMTRSSLKPFLKTVLWKPTVSQGWLGEQTNPSKPIKIEREIFSSTSLSHLYL